MKKQIEPRILKGFRDGLPLHVLRRNRMMATITEVFESFGYEPIDTPALEYTEILLGKGGGDTDKQIYRFEDQGGRDIALRYDLTVPFARYAVQHRSELPLPFKRYHIGKVWRGEKPQKGRYREFFQCDCDVVGTDTPLYDCEVIHIMHSALEALNVSGFTIRFSHRGFLNAFIERRTPSAKAPEILRIIDKLPKIGEEETERQLCKELSPEAASETLEFLRQGKDFDETVEKLTTLSGNTDAGERMRKVRDLLYAAAPNGSFALDPTITRGLDYYTGIVFETFLDGREALGSVCSGGRYDNLTGLFAKEELPGVGASIGLDRLMAAAEEANSDGTREIGVCDVLIFGGDTGDAPRKIRIANHLRSHGITTEIYPEKKKFNHQYKYAETKQIPFAVICEDGGMVTVKSLIGEGTVTEKLPEDSFHEFVLKMRREAKTVGNQELNIKKEATINMR